ASRTRRYLSSPEASSELEKKKRLSARSLGAATGAGAGSLARGSGSTAGLATAGDEPSDAASAAIVGCSQSWSTPTERPRYVSRSIVNWIATRESRPSCSTDCEGSIVDAVTFSRLEIQAMIQRSSPLPNSFVDAGGTARAVSLEGTIAWASSMG